MNLSRFLPRRIQRPGSSVRELSESLPRAAGNFARIAEPDRGLQRVAEACRDEPENLQSFTGSQ